MKYLLFIPLLTLFGCAGIQINTSGTETLKNSIRKTQVNTYTYDEMVNLQAKQVGYVETRHCQVNHRARKPDRSDFIDTLKIKTQKLGANALVFDACIVNNTAACNIETVCRGIAYRVD